MSLNLTKILIRYGITGLLLSFLITTQATARIPTIYFRGITEQFMPEKQLYSPTLGMVALESGLIHNLRFYGNYQEAWRNNKDTGLQERDYINDFSTEPLWNLIKVLFPSPAGTLATQTSADSNFGRFASPRTVAMLLNFANDMRDQTAKTRDKLAQMLKSKSTTKEIEAAANDEAVGPAPVVPAPMVGAAETPLPENAHATAVTSEAMPAQGTSGESEAANPPATQLPNPEKPKGTSVLMTLKQFQKMHTENPEWRATQEQLADVAHETARIPLTPAQQDIMKHSSQKKTPKGEKPTKAERQKQTSSAEKPLLVSENPEQYVQFIVENILRSMEGDLNQSQRKNLRKDLSNLLYYIIAVIEQEQAAGAIYPQYTTEQVISAFFCERFDTQKALEDLLTNLGETIINKTQPYQPAEIDAAYLAQLQADPTAIKNIDDLYALANVDLFTRSTPYKPDAGLISNGATKPFDRVKNIEISEARFSDCVETAIRHIMNLMLYNNETKQFDLSTIVQHVSGSTAIPPNSPFEKFLEFYAMQLPMEANNGSLDMRSKWNQVVGDLNRPENSGVAYNKSLNAGEFDLKSGYINLIKICQKLFNLHLDNTSQNNVLSALDLNTASLIQKQNWVQAYLTALFKVLNPRYNYSIVMEQIQERLPQDIVGNVKVVIKDTTDQDLFSFVIRFILGHGEVINLKDYKATMIENPQAMFQAMYMLPADTAARSLWGLVPKPAKPVDLEPLYRLTSGHINDNEAILRCLTFIAQNVGILSKREKAIANFMLPHLLLNISWNDQHTVTQLSAIIPTLLKFFPEVAGLIKGIVFPVEASEQNVNDTLAQLPGLEYLWIAGNLQIKSLYLSSPTLKMLEVSNTAIETLDLTGIPSLETLRLTYNLALNTLILGDNKELKILSMSDSEKIQTLDLMGAPALEELSLGYDKNLNSLILGEKRDLERLVLSGLTIKNLDLTGSPTLKILFVAESSIESLDLTKNIVLEELRMNKSSIKNLMLGNKMALKKLSVTRNELGAEWIVQLVPALHKMSNLQVLDLLNNHLGAEEIAALAPALQTMKNLHTLDLALNQLGAAGIEALAPALQTMKNLHTLNLALNQLGVTELSALLPALEEMPNLRTLNLGGNKLYPEESVVSMVTALLQRVPNLQTLSLKGNQWGYVTELKLLRETFPNVEVDA